MAQTEPGVLGESLNTNTNAVVIGEGAIGIMTAMLLKIMGCRNVILTGHKDEKLKKAQEISRCDYVINSNKMEKKNVSVISVRSQTEARIWLSSVPIIPVRPSKD